MKTLKLITLIGILLCSINLSAQEEYSINQEQQEEINRRFKLKLCEFQNLLETLANKEYMNTVDCENGVTVNTGKKISSEEDARILIKNAVNRYFAYGDKSLIEVTNSKGEKTKRYISSYLQGLYQLPYKKVNIVFANTCMIDSIRRGVDGLFYGTIVVEQRFTGKGELMYTDKEFKSFDVIVDVDPDEPNKIEVKIGDILVAEQR